MRFFLKLRQQESNLRWGSQSPLPYRLAMAHHAKQYSIFSAVPQEVRRIFAAFSVRCLPHLRRFGSVFGLCGRGPAFSISFHVFTKGKFCGMRFSKNTVRRGHKIHIAKVRFIFFPDFSYYFLKRLYFLLRFWYTGCDKNKLKKLCRCPGCPPGGAVSPSL